MHLRIIVIFIIFGIFLVFIMFNLDNRCDINFGFLIFTEVPVFLTVFITFSAGFICAVPLVMQLKKKNIQKPEQKYSQSADASSDKPVDAMSARAKFLARKQKDSSDGGS